MDGSRYGCALGSPELEHRLHVFAEEGSLDSHLVGQIGVDDTSDALEDMSEFEIGVGKFPEVDDTHGDHLRLVAHNLYQSVSHDICTRVDAENYLFHIPLRVIVAGRLSLPYLSMAVTA